jgi:coenzyme F420-reducing hydrogenase beta subunit
MVLDGEGFLYPEIVAGKCVKCGRCRLVCPVISRERLPRHAAAPRVVAAWNLDPEIRRQSSSGGVFTVLAEEILARGGVVFGAGFDSQWQLRHQAARSPAELAQFRGSKYLQSDTGDSFSRIQEWLQQGTWVLFTGTPCQVAGLYAFLGTSYETLLTCDLVCHGAPSPKVFRKYVESMAKGEPVTSFCFRDKRQGWKRYRVAMKTADGPEYCVSGSEDLFMQGFLNDVYLRPSCHVCPAIGIPRQGDITLGDFWGIGKTRPELDDDQGTSLILLNSPQGQAFFDHCASRLFVAEASLETAIQGNPSLVRPATAHPARKKFFKNLDRIDFPTLIPKCLPPPGRLQIAWCRVKSVIRRGLKSALFSARKKK